MDSPKTIMNGDYEIYRTRCRLLLLIPAVTTFAYIICVGTGKFLEPCVDLTGDLSSSYMPYDYPKRSDEERSGKRLQVILLSTWRSGSSFTGELLASIPNVLYYFEPLFYLPDFLCRIQGPPKSDEAIILLRTLLNCNHSLLTANDGLMKKSAPFLPHFNSSTKICGAKMTLCRKPEFTEALCRKAPIHVMKIVRLHLNIVESLLADNSLPLRVLYLVRDPRGTLNSRMKAYFVSKYNRIPNILCTDLVSEFDAAKRLHKTYPNQFKVVRYEDLAENTTSVAEEILHFLGVEMYPQVVEFIEQHTHKEKEGVFTDTRNSSYTASKWTKELSWDLIKEVQDDEMCRRAMKMWGYKRVTEASIQQECVPYLNSTEYDFERFI